MTKPYTSRGGGGRELESIPLKERWRVSQAFYLFLVFSLLTRQAYGQFFRPEASFSNQGTQMFSATIEPLTWWGSNWAALDSQARLAMSSDALQQYLLSDPKHFSSRHWLGVAKLPTRWKWLDGSELLTYRGEMKTSPDSRFDHLLDIEGDAFSCLLKCQTAVVAIQGLICRCYDTLPDAVTSMEPPPCARDIYCFGSLEGASVYDYSHLAHRFPWNGDSDAGQVAYTRKVPPGNIACFHTSSSPSHPRRFLCKTQPTKIAYLIRPPTGLQFNCSGELCASTSYNMQSWDLARGSCSSYIDNDLASLTTSDFDDLARVTSEWEELWIGLRREGVMKSIDGSDYMGTASENELLPVWTCLAASVQRAGKGGYDIQLHFDNCSSTLPAILEMRPNSTQDGDGEGTFAGPTSFSDPSMTQNSTSNDTDRDQEPKEPIHPAIIVVSVLFSVTIIGAAVSVLCYFHFCAPGPTLPIVGAVTLYPPGGDAARSNMGLPPPPPPDRAAHDYLHLFPDSNKPDDAPDDGYEVPIPHSGPSPLPKDAGANESIYDEPDLNQGAGEAQSVSEAVTPASKAENQGSGEVQSVSEAVTPVSKEENQGSGEVQSVSEAVTPVSKAEDTPVDNKDDGDIYETVGESRLEEQGQTEQTAVVVRL